MKNLYAVWDSISMWTWEILQTIIGLFVILIYGAKFYTRIGKRYIFTSKRMPGGISLGAFIVLDSYYEKDPVTQHHEYGHTRQSMILGPLYLFTVGICSILNAAFDFTSYYYDFWTEKWADHLGGITREGGKHHRRVTRDTMVW